MKIRRSAENYSPKRQFSASGWALFSALLIPFLLNLLWSFLAGRVMAGNLPEFTENPFFRWAVSFLPIYGLGIPLGMFLLKRLPSEQGEQHTLTVKSFLCIFLMCFPITVSGSFLGNILAQLFSLGRSSNNVMELVSRQDPLTMLTMVILAPLMEELFFRRFLIDRTVRFGEKNAILFSALAFSLFHCNLYQAFYAFGIGLLFGYVYVRTRKIGYTMALHFLINFLSGVVAAYFLNLADPEILEVMNTGDTEALLALAETDPQRLLALYASLLPLMLQNLITFGLAIGGGIMMGIQRKKFIFRQPSGEIPGRQIVSIVYLNAGVICFAVLSLIETVMVLVSTC